MVVEARPQGAERWAAVFGVDDLTRPGESFVAQETVAGAMKQLRRLPCTPLFCPRDLDLGTLCCRRVCCVVEVARRRCSLAKGKVSAVITSQRAGTVSSAVSGSRR